MFTSVRTFSEINKYLAIIQVAIKQKGCIGFNDDKTACENFFIGLFNRIYGLDLINVNSIASSYPAIDLGDTNSSICYQITFENTLKKIKETRKKYEEHDIDKDYKKLIIFIYGAKPSSRKKEDDVIYLENVFKPKYETNKTLKIFGFYQWRRS